jgi:hypothetical protein
MAAAVRKERRGPRGEEDVAAIAAITPPPAPSLFKEGGSDAATGKGKQQGDWL